MPDNPYFVLGLESTLDVARIKRAYFSALSRTPPHIDPEGFRRLRAAYEALTDEKTRTLRFLQTPPDAAGELERFERTWGKRIAEARARAQREQEASRAVERFI